ncbi:MAG: hypothetical protein RL585_2680 [Pseudomonadota bacterium]
MSTSDQKPISYSAPRILGDQAGFWEAAKAGRFLIKRCKDCAKAHWFPRALCPFCMVLHGRDRLGRSERSG